MENTGTFPTISKNCVRTCCITMNMADRLRLLACPPALVPKLRDAIKATWDEGIHAERVYNGSHEFKLRGSPWHSVGTNAVSSRRLLCGILSAMASMGWNLIQSTDVSKREGDKDSLFFEKGTKDEEARLFVVSFNQTNRIRLIEAPDMMPCIVDACTDHWSKGIEEESELDQYCVELKLKGNPWYPVGEDGTRSKLVLCQIIANFRSLGFKLYACVDMSYGTEGQDLETWVFRRIWHDMEYVPTVCSNCGKCASNPEYFGQAREEDPEEAAEDE